MANLNVHGSPPILSHEIFLQGKKRADAALTAYVRCRSAR
jgi:hypothetical protein